MVKDEVYCIDILNQTSAVKKSIIICRRFDFRKSSFNACY